MQQQISPRRKMKLPLVIGTVLMAVVGSGAHAQTRAELAAERRAMAEQRLQALSDNRAERAMRRTEALVRMSEVTPEMVEQRLSQAEVRMLDALAEADAEMIASRANEVGAKVTEGLTGQEFENLTDEQVDSLVAAAARAASITPQEVESLLDAGAVQLSEFFDDLDPESIASTLNEIGEKGLGVSVVN